MAMLQFWTQACSDEQPAVWDELSSSFVTAITISQANQPSGPEIQSAYLFTRRFYRECWLMELQPLPTHHPWVTVTQGLGPGLPPFYLFPTGNCFHGPCLAAEVMGLVHGPKLEGITELLQALSSEVRPDILWCHLSFSSTGSQA